MSRDTERTTIDTDLVGQRLLFDHMRSEGTGKANRQPRRQRTKQAATRKPTMGDGGSDEHDIADVMAAMDRIVGRLTALESAISALRDELHVRQTVKEFYTTAEIAQLLGRRPYTVREWCRLGRINAEKAHSGRGLDEEWRVSHDELVRIQNEGLLAVQKYSHVASPRRLPK